MKKIIDYMIFEPADRYGNVRYEGIKQLMDEGWQPLGGLCACCTVNNNNNLYQVMVKYEKDN